MDADRDATDGRYSVVLPLVMNDSSSNGEPLTLGTIDPPSSLPAGGTIRREADGTVFFEGDVGMVGTRLFEYQVSSSGQTGTGTVWVFEGGVTAPIYDARDDAFNVPAGVQTPLTVLANDLVASGHTATIASFSSRTLQNGWVEPVPDALVPTLRYRPPTSTFAGLDEFSYAGQVGSSSDTATVRLNVQPALNPIICWLVTRRPGLGPLDYQIDTSCTAHPEWFEERCFHFGDEIDQATEDCAPPAEPGHPFAFFHSYPAPGRYDVRGRFTVPPSAEVTRLETFILSDTSPVPRIAMGECVRTTCPFSAWQSSDNEPLTNFAWSFGDGSPIVRGRDVTHDFGSLGDFTVILAVTDTAGQSEALTQTVSLTDHPPVAQFTADCSLSVPRCLFASTSTDDFGTIAGYEWRWTNLATGASGVLATSSTAELTSSLPGTYEVTLEVADSMGQVSLVPQTVTLSGALTAAPDWVALPVGGAVVAFDPRANDFGPGAPFVIESVETPRYGTVQVVSGSLEYTSFGGRPVEADRFGYTLRNGLNQRAQGVIRVISRPMAEAGRISSVSHGQQVAKLAGGYPEPPLVFLSPATANEADWVRPRLSAVGTNDFTVRLEEPSNAPYDGVHGSETVDFFAVLPVWNDDGHKMGSGWLEGGLRYVAGRTMITLPLDPELPILRRRLSLPLELTESTQRPPIVLAEIQPPGPYFGLTPALSARVEDLTRNGFSLRLEAPGGGIPAGESVEVAWIAIEIVAGRGADAFFEAAPISGVTDIWHRIDFRQPYFSPPVFLSGFEGIADPDPAILRQRALTARSVEVRAQEDLTEDPETSHGEESVGYLAFEAAGAIFGGVPVDTLFSVPGEHALSAQDDFVVVEAGGSQRIQVLDNDIAGAGSLAIAWLTPAPLNGTVEVLGTGEVLYQPLDREYVGNDEFGYIVTDSTGTTAAARVFIQISGGR